MLIFNILPCIRLNVLSTLLAQIVETIDPPNLNKILLFIKKVVGLSLEQNSLVLLFDFRHLSPPPVSLIPSAVH